MPTLSYKGTKEDHETPNSGSPVSWQRFELGAFKIRIYSFPPQVESPLLKTKSPLVRMRTNYSKIFPNNFEFETRFDVKFPCWAARMWFFTSEQMLCIY
jgi:hypothetical protein